MNALSKLYSYQKDVVTQTLYHNKGIVCLPTGTGKTFCQAAVIANDIVQNPYQHRVYVVNAPRILLTFQLLKEVYGFLVGLGIESRYGFVHSGGSVDERELEDMRIMSNIDGNEIPFSQINSTTSSEGVKEMIGKAKEQDLPIILFSTYNSVDKIEQARTNIKQPISIMLNDEAHYLVQERFHNIIDTIRTARCYFFTATMISTPSDEGRGMNNTETYGEVLYKMIPREAIDLGKMVKPRIHLITSDKDYDEDDYDGSLSRTIKTSFEEHRQLTKDLGSKMLVTVRGTRDMVRFLGSKEYKELISNGVNIFTISSTEEVGCDINGVKVKRQDFLSTLKSYGEDRDKEMIVLHYDILAEGIDVSGFTGVLLLRTLSKSKFLQTYGRVARLDKRDRDNFTKEITKPTDYDELYKPYAYIIIPDLVKGNQDDKENFRELIYELRDYGFKPLEDIVSSSIVRGLPEDIQLEGLNELKKKSPVVGDVIEDYISKIENESLAKLSPIEQYKQLITK